MFHMKQCVRCDKTLEIARQISVIGQMFHVEQYTVLWRSLGCSFMENKIAGNFPITERMFNNMKCFTEICVEQW